MLWVVMSLCFFGFLRLGEVVLPSDSSYDQTNPSYFQVSLKRLKADQFRNGMKIMIGCAVCPLCRVVSVLAYMALRGQVRTHSSGSRMAIF